MARGDGKRGVIVIGRTGVSGTRGVHLWVQASEARSSECFDQLTGVSAWDVGCALGPGAVVSLSFGLVLLEFSRFRALAWKGTERSEDVGCKTRFISCFPSSDHRSTVARKKV